LERISRRLVARAREPRCQFSVTAATLPTTLATFCSFTFESARFEAGVPSGILASFGFCSLFSRVSPQHARHPLRQRGATPAPWSAAVREVRRGAGKKRRSRLERANHLVVFVYQFGPGKSLLLVVKKGRKVKKTVFPSPQRGCRSPWVVRG